MTRNCWTFPWPTGVSVNHIYLANGRGGRRLSDEARAFKDEISVIIRQDIISAGVHPFPVGGGNLAFHLDIHPPDKRHRDGDNFLKLICDGTASGLMMDDWRFSEHHVVRFPASDHPRLVVWVTKAGLAVEMRQ